MRVAERGEGGEQQESRKDVRIVVDGYSDSEGHTCSYYKDTTGIA